MNKKQFIINITSNITAFLVNVIMSFFLTPYLIKVLGKETYSFYPLANNFVEYANVFAIAFNSVAARFVSVEIHKGNSEKANVYFNSILFSNIIIGLICAAVSFCVIFQLEKIINIPQDMVIDVKILFALVFLNFIINLSSVALGICTTVRNRLELTSLRKMEASFIRLIITITLLFVFSPRIFYVGAGVLVATLFVLITNWVYTKKLLPEMRISRLYFRLYYAKEVIMSGMWNSVNNLGELLFSGFNLILANIFVGVSQAGNLSISRTVPSFMISLTATVVTVFVPSILKTYAVGTKKELVSILRSSATIISVIINLPLTIFLVFGKEFYQLWVPGEDINSIYIITIILVFPIIFNSSISCLKNIFIAMNKFKFPAVILCASGGLNLLLTIIILKIFPEIGVFGIIVTSSVIRIMYNMIFSVLYVSRLLNTKAYKLYITIIKSILLVVSVFIIGELIKPVYKINTWIDLFAMCVILGIIGLVISAFVILNRNDRKRLLNMIKDVFHIGDKKCL